MTKREVLQELLDGNKIDVYHNDVLINCLSMDDNGNIEARENNYHPWYIIHSADEVICKKHQELMTFTEALIKMNKIVIRCKITYPGDSSPWDYWNVAGHDDSSDSILFFTNLPEEIIECIKNNECKFTVVYDD